MKIRGKKKKGRYYISFGGKYVQVNKDLYYGLKDCFENNRRCPNCGSMELAFTYQPEYCFIRCKECGISGPNFFGPILRTGPLELTGKGGAWKAWDKFCEKIKKDVTENARDVRKNMKIKYEYDHRSQRLLDEAERALASYTEHLENKFGYLRDNPIMFYPMILEDPQRAELLRVIEHIKRTAVLENIRIFEDKTETNIKQTSLIGCCRNCLFFNEFINPDRDEPFQGFCRRRSPDARSGSPQVSWDMYCGEFKDK